MYMVSFVCEKCCCTVLYFKQKSSYIFVQFTRCCRSCMSTQLTIVVQKLLVISILKNHTTLTTFQPMFIKYRMSKSNPLED